MAPSKKAVTKAITEAVHNVFNSDEREDLTVRFIRNKVEEELDLEPGTLAGPEWKQETKVLIQELATKLMDEEEGSPAPNPPPAKVKKESVKSKPAPAKKATPASAKKGTKRASAEIASRPKKRQKKEVTPSDEENDILSSNEELSDPFSDSDAPKPTKVTKKTPSKRLSKSKAKAKVESESGEEEDHSEELIDDSDEDSDVKPKPKVKSESAVKARSKKQKVESEEDSDVAPKSSAVKKAPGRKSKTKVESDSGQELKKPIKKSVSPALSRKAKTESPETKKQGVKSKKEGSSDEEDKIKSKAKAKTEDPVSEDDEDDEDEKPETRADDSDSEMSIVLDEAPKPKRSSKKSTSTTSKTKAPKAKAAPKATKDLSPQEAEIKTLQAQLKKCGVNKIWAFELKQFGDDNGKKIRYLKEKLREVGITGRFSEAKAAEIKEMRELAADVEAVTQGNEQWGTEGRARRSAGRGKLVQRKNYKAESEDDDSDGEEGGGSEKRPELSAAEKFRLEMADFDDDSDED